MHKFSGCAGDGTDSSEMEKRLIKVLCMPSLAMELLYLFTSISMYVLCHGNRFNWAFEFDE